MYEITKLDPRNDKTGDMGWKAILTFGTGSIASVIITLSIDMAFLVDASDRSMEQSRIGRVPIPEDGDKQWLRQAVNGPTSRVSTRNCRKTYEIARKGYFYRMPCEIWRSWKFPVCPFLFSIKKSWCFPNKNVGVVTLSRRLGNVLSRLGVSQRLIAFAEKRRQRRRLPEKE